VKAFIVGTVTAIVIAVAAGFVLENSFSRDTEATLAAPSVRIGPESSAQYRGWERGAPRGEEGEG
jgi:hypothetical protein